MLFIVESAYANKIAAPVLQQACMIKIICHKRDLYGDNENFKFWKKIVLNIFLLKKQTRVTGKVVILFKLSIMVWWSNGNNGVRNPSKTIFNQTFSLEKNDAWLGVLITNPLNWNRPLLGYDSLIGDHALSRVNHGNRSTNETYDLRPPCDWFLGLVAS